MAEVPWHVFGTSRCPHCGSEVPVVRLLQGGHECAPELRGAHELARLDEQVEALHFEIDEFLDSPTGRKQLAFARWCREHRG